MTVRWCLLRLSLFQLSIKGSSGVLTYPGPWESPRPNSERIPHAHNRIPGPQSCLGNMYATSWGMPEESSAVDFKAEPWKGPDAPRTEGLLVYPVVNAVPSRVGGVPQKVFCEIL